MISLYLLCLLVHICCANKRTIFPSACDQVSIESLTRGFSNAKRLQLDLSNVLGKFSRVGNRKDTWQERFRNTSIQTIHSNGFHFTSSNYEMAYFIWDIFLRENELVIITSRILPINMDDVTVYLHGIKKRLQVTEVSCADLPRKNYPDEVIIGRIHSDSIKRYIDTLKSQNRPLEMKVTVELYNYRQSYILLPHPLPAIPHDGGVIMLAKYGPDIQPQELLTFIEYYVTIGVDAFYIYFMIPIQQIAEDALEMWKTSRHAHRLTFVQWYPFHVKGPFPGSHRQQERIFCSEIGLINDALYRLKFSKIASQIWLGVVDLDDYMVVHPQYGNLKQMIAAFPSNSTAGIRFENSYFYMLDTRVEGAAAEDPVQSEKALVPSGYGWDVMKHEKTKIVYEGDLSHHIYRPKIVFNVDRVLSGGVHRVDVSKADTHVYESNSFYLHHIKRSRGRNSSLVICRKETSMNELLRLPRPVSVSEGFLKWEINASLPSFGCIS